MFQSFAKFLLAAILALFVFVKIVKADDNAPKQFVYLDDWTYTLIGYWLNNGDLSIPFVLNQPYRIGDIEQNLAINNDWTRYQKKYYHRFFGQPGVGKIIVYARDNYSFVSDADMPKTKGRQQAPVDDVFLFENATKNHYNLSGQFNVMLPHISLVNRTMINSEKVFRSPLS